MNSHSKMRIEKREERQKRQEADSRRGAGAPVREGQVEKKANCMEGDNAFLINN